MLIMSVAGVAVLWRNFLEMNPRVRDLLRKYLPAALFKALTCGSCFTYWIALAAVVMVGSSPGPLHLFLDWMATAMGASIIRFGYVYIQESVHDIVHSRDRHEGHGHPH